jgi:hypothetical protein
MKDYLKHIQSYAQLLQQSAVWNDSREILAPIITDDGSADAADNYIYEFYCYICIIVDLRHNYELEFIEGDGKFQFMFPRAASLKKGKPRFHARKNGNLEFQICAGTKINGIIDSEKNHPDISFQQPAATDDPSETDLIIIMDAKFKEGNNASLPKDEVYKFGIIVDLFDLRKQPSINIDFHAFKEFYGNCLISNAKAYSDPADLRLLKKYAIKEVENFLPNQKFNVLG